MGLGQRWARRSVRRLPAKHSSIPATTAPRARIRGDIACFTTDAADLTGACLGAGACQSFLQTDELQLLPPVRGELRALITKDPLMNEFRNGLRRNEGGRRNGTARQQLQAAPSGTLAEITRYLVLAREGPRAGDTIEAENCYQHAEQYFRVMQESDRGRGD